MQGGDWSGAAKLDLVVVGGGFAGIYALQRSISSGMKALLLEREDGVGGVWYANRYPGARCDTVSLQYSYSFSDELQQDWHWPEIYSSRDDIVGYVEHVIDRFGLRSHIRCRHAVSRAVFDEAAALWCVETLTGERYLARFLVLAVGCLSRPVLPEVPDLASFEGIVLRTSAWPTSGVKLDGKSVALVGTGSSGVQATPRLAEVAAQLFVVQRTPNYSIPLRNREVSEDDPAVREWKANYVDRRRAALQTGGYELSLEPPPIPGRLLSEEEREAEFERRWAMGGGLAFMGTYADMKSDPGVNAQASEFMRRKIRETVRDRAIAERLVPEIALGAKRICADTGYYEAFNRDNVDLIDLRSEPWLTTTADEIRTAKRDVKVDVIILATGFDAVTGAFSDIEIVGRNGQMLSDKWRMRPLSYLGVAVAGFPNLFMVTGPGSPSILTNGVISGEQGVNWIVRCIETARRQSCSVIEAKNDAEARWTDYVAAIGAGSLLLTANSYAVGANVSGKPRHILPFAASASVYRELCNTIATDGYRGFVMT